ncbi:hypothetical protein [Streptomyces sp. NPDC005859]|uniref:hypothetical protein n=1 Tax=Streptomyces sp. NPDC005859 TaxID=3157170 RepID=UPI0034098383
MPDTALTPEDQAVVEAFRAMLTAVRNPEPWTPGRAQGVAVRIGPFIVMRLLHRPCSSGIRVVPAAFG